MKKMLSFIMVMLLVLGLTVVAFADDNTCVPGIAVLTTYEHTNEIGLAGYNKANMEENLAINSFIKVEQIGTELKVTYINPYVVDGKIYLLESFYYKAGQSVFLVTLDTPLNLGECGMAALGSNSHGQQDISHIATFNSSFIPPTITEIEYKEETAWAYIDGAKGLNSIIKSSRWGWYLDAAVGTYDVYAAAAQNDLSKGTLIGKVVVSIVDDYYAVEFIPIGDHYITNIHFGVYKSLNDITATKGAPGQFTNKVEASEAKYMLIHFNAMVAQ